MVRSTALFFALLAPNLCLAQGSRTPVYLSRTGQDSVGALFEAALKQELSRSTHYIPRYADGVKGKFEFEIELATVDAAENNAQQGKRSVVSVVIQDFGTGDSRLWLWFGVLAGLGLENKYSTLSFGFAVTVALLVTHHRREFTRKWIWIAGAIALALLLPNIIWQIRHHFPTIEDLANEHAPEHRAHTHILAEMRASDKSLAFTRHVHECASRIAHACGHTKLMPVGSNR